MPLFQPRAQNPIQLEPAPMQRMRPERNSRPTTASGQRVNAETARTISTAYRCENVISDDVAKMPLQTFISHKIGELLRVKPDAQMMNIAYRLEVQPNRWMTPFVFKKTLMKWLLFWGNAFIWQPAGGNRELFILSSDSTYPTFDTDGNLWYITQFPNGKQSDPIPAVEVLQLMINSEDGFNGRSVLTFARETFGRQLGAYESENKLYSQGFNAAGIAWLNGEGTPEIRAAVRDAYTEAVSGSKGFARVAVFDNKITKFDQITMKPTDMQFLEGIDATDAQIANFFGLPLYKINRGKQSYESNAQQQLDYLSSTLDPYLVQWEQAAGLRWLQSYEQPFTYFRFERNAILRVDPGARNTYLTSMVQNGQMSINEARQTEDRPGIGPKGDFLYMPANITRVASTDPNASDPNDPSA